MQWVKATTEFPESHEYSSGMSLNKTHHWIFGGAHDVGQTTLLVSPTEPTTKTDFVFGQSYWNHCSFRSKTRGFITGGHWCFGSHCARKGTFDGTFQVDLVSQSISENGPVMKNKRSNHGCASFTLGQKTFGIVAGGYDRDAYKFLDSVEIIDLDTDSLEWKEGNKLPYFLKSHVILIIFIVPELKLPTPMDGLKVVLTGQGLLIVGGQGNGSYPDYRDEIFKLSCTGDDIESCSWTTMTSKLAVGRKNHVVIPVPDTFELN